MLKRLIKDVDFTRHHRWLERAAGPATPLAACSADGTLLWTSGGADGAALAETLKALDAACFGARFEGGGMTSHDLGDAGTLLLRPVDDASAQRLGWLATRVARFDAAAAPLVLDVLADALEDLGAAIVDDCRLRFELNGMTEELSERYEELHLVYGTDRYVRDHTQELEVFRALLANCAAQMDVDVVAFLRPVEKLCLSATELSKPIHNLDLVLVEMRGDLFRFVQSTGETVILNEDDDPRRAYVFTDMPYRVMACPVRRTTTIDAQLVLLNHAHKPPFSNSDRRLAEVLANQLSSLGQTYALMSQLARFNEQLAAALIEAVEAKDPYTRGHSERVHHISMEIGRAWGLAKDELEHLFWGSLLHDVGKIGIPDAVLCKPGKLTADEYAFIMVHPERSYEILRHVEYLKDAVPGARHHQEMFDGKGYPHGLKGDRIPLNARIIAVADTYDSITSSRAYRAGRSHELAMREMGRVAGTQLDPAVMEVFRTVVAAEPEWLVRFAISRERVPEAVNG
jgi:HD-GYP domain-containing protein (c-di-GMP phosphodiesterase class II)